MTDKQTDSAEAPLIEIDLAKDRITQVNAAASAYLGKTETELKQASAQTLLAEASSAAQYDQLTGLPNRKLLLDRLQQGILDAKRHQQQLAMLYLDLDGFKPVNDTFGHAAGDELLIQISQAITEQIREGDTLARIGGDEFVLLLKDVHGEGSLQTGVERVAQQIIERLGESFELTNAEVEVGASIGIALYPQDAEDGDALMQNADMAMYRAKNNGRNQLVCYQAEMNKEAHHRLHLEKQLRRLLKQDELVLAFEPIYDLRDNSVFALDAKIAADNNASIEAEFEEVIKVAETAFLGIELGEWQLRQALLALKQLEEASCGTFVSVRLNPMHFRQKPFVEWLEGQLVELDVSADALVLELSEACLSLPNINLTERMTALSKLGVQLHIENFGAGFTSLKHLAKLDVSAIKVAGFFNERLSMSRASESMVSAILAFAYQLDLERLAAGVTSAEQLSFLHSHQCHYAQGAYFGEPILLDDLEDFVNDSFKGEQDLDEAYSLEDDMS